MKSDDLRLYAVTDRAWLNGRELAEDVRLALDGGATMVQLREKHLDDDAFLQEAKTILKLCRSRSVPFIVNDNLAVAVKCGADGIHVGQSDTEAGRVRRLIGDDMILGVSACTVDEAVKAEKDGADYIGVGTMFVTGTKSDARPVTIDTLREICMSVSIPVVAIGGITKDNMHLLNKSGICGVALVSAIFAAGDITAATKKLFTLTGELL